jgi:hypothetical protein
MLERARQGGEWFLGAQGNDQKCAWDTSWGWGGWKMVQAGKASKFGLLRVTECETKWFKGLARPAPPRPGPIGWSQENLKIGWWETQTAINWNEGNGKWFYFSGRFENFMVWTPFRLEEWNKLPSLIPHFILMLMSYLMSALFLPLERYKCRLLRI